MDASSSSTDENGEVPSSVIWSLPLALQAVLRARGLAYGVDELSQALVLALQDPVLAGAWQGGSDSLAAAAVDSAEDLAAMGAALDEALAA